MCSDGCDATLHEDAIQTTPGRGPPLPQRTDIWRGQGEPIQPVQLQGPEEVVGWLYSVPNKTEGHVFKKFQVSGISMSIVKANCSSRSPLLYLRPEAPQGSQDFPPVRVWPPAAPAWAPL